MRREYFRVAIVVGAMLLTHGVLNGCGSCNTPATTGSGRAGPVTFTVQWAQRSRATGGPPSALSALLTITGAKPGGSDLVYEADRRADPASYTQTYTLTAGEALAGGPYAATVQFFDQLGGQGDAVASGGKQVTINADATDIGDFSLVGKVASVSIPSSQTVAVGQAVDLQLSVRDAAGNTLAITRGSAIWAPAGDGTILGLTQDGHATGIAVGQTSVTATVDGHTSPPQTIMVTAAGGGGGGPPLCGDVACWKFEEGSGAIANDSSGSGNHGTLNADTGGKLPSWITGVTGSALHFDGTGYVKVPRSVSLEPTNVTVEAWVRNPKGDYVIAKGSYSCYAASYAINLAAATFYVYTKNGALETFYYAPQTSVNLADGNWHYVAGTYDGAKVRFFVDGVESGNGSPAGGAIKYGGESDGSLYIGWYSTCNLPYTGDVDDVAIWSRALTPAEIASHAHAGRALRSRSSRAH